MWATLIIRILRKRVVLALIFTLSLCYCIFNLWYESPDHYSYEIKGENLKISIHWHSDLNQNETFLESLTCRNSVQGKVLIADDKGFVCSRSDVMSTGCCSGDSQNTRRFVCDTCKENGCCSIYEYCISCCLHPDKKKILQYVLGKASEDVLLASVSDHFELCLAKCRTSSQSVLHENSYRDPRAKHCFGETPKEEVAQN